MDATKVLMTQEGLADLKQEYDALLNHKRPDAVQRVAAARDQGDLAENSEYAAAREELTFIDGRIAELEEILHKAQLISDKHSSSAVDVGCRVTVHIDGKKEIFTIVGEWEANPMQKKISHSSPLGKALMGKKIGEKAQVEAPAGTITYKIVSIE